MLAAELEPAASNAPPVVRIERRDRPRCVWKGNVKRSAAMVLLLRLDRSKPSAVDLKFLAL